MNDGDMDTTTNNVNAGTEMALWSQPVWLRAAVVQALTRADLMTPASARRRLAARKLEMTVTSHEEAATGPGGGAGGEMPQFRLYENESQRQLLAYLIKMGSFNSAPKILNEDTQDDEFELPACRMSLHSVVDYCQKQRRGLPGLLRRRYAVADTGERFANVPLQDSNRGTIRVLQWNVLSQALGQHGDGFVVCPPEALDWDIRKYAILQTIAEAMPDVACLQEVDHYTFLQKSLSVLGYKGIFRAKPDSPCLHYPENNGPDGCAIFYREDKLRLIAADTRILEIWKMPTNQVVISAIFESLDSGTELCVATTHLKARRGALMSKLRDEQGKDLLEFLAMHAGTRPLILCGDFNAEPNEPVYQRVISNRTLGLASAYAELANSPNGLSPECSSDREPPYTTWKIRERAEECHTLDYVCYTRDAFVVQGGLMLPSECEIGPERLPSFSYPSDHLSLVCDLKLTGDD